MENRWYPIHVRENVQEIHSRDRENVHSIDGENAQLRWGEWGGGGKPCPILLLLHHHHLLLLDQTNIYLHDICISLLHSCVYNLHSGKPYSTLFLQSHFSVYHSMLSSTSLWYGAELVFRPRCKRAWEVWRKKELMRALWSNMEDGSPISIWC